MITRGISIASKGMQSLLDMNDTIANNLANVNTSGFKKSALTFKNIYDARIEQASAGQGIKTADYRYLGNLSMGSATDRSMVAFTQGTLSRTGNPMDVAIEGDGFFKIQDVDGKISYTRNGQFCVNNQNKLVTKDGEYVLDIKNKKIDVDLEKNQTTLDQIVFREKGQIVINNPKNPQMLQQIAIYDFSDKENLVPNGNAKFIPSNPDVNPQLIAEKFNLQQGSIELSNTSTINEMINSINVSRTYETLSKMVKEDSNLLDVAINMGRVRL